VPYFHVVFTLPAAIADIAYQNKAARACATPRARNWRFRAGNAR
jgi:hypothetical protein